MAGISQCIVYNWNLEHWLLDCVLCIIIMASSAAAPVVCCPQHKKERTLFDKQKMTFLLLFVAVVDCCRSYN
jgi:hypothetical protein